MIHRVDVVESTQTLARDLAASGVAVCGDVVVARTQSAGRGRRGRSWQSPVGGLYATWILPHDPLIAVRSGTAVARALRGVGCPVALKWPNDVLVGDKKIAGLLVETSDGVSLVGVGVNRDSEPLPDASSLVREGVDVSVDTLVVAIDRELRAVLSDSQVLAEYRQLLSTLGRQVRVEHDNGSQRSGVAVDVDSLGRLVVDDGTATALVAAGRCVHLRQTTGVD